MKVHNNAAYYASGVVDGLAQALDNLEVQYTYHIHEGSEGTTANGCYITPVYHSHVSSCYSSHTSSWMHTGEHVQTGTEGQWACQYQCSICGQRYSQNNNQGSHSTKPPTKTHSTLICTKSTSTIDNYTLGCGKNEGDIESAIIIY